MSDPGMKFAQSQLEKYGWSEGKGLGRKEGGITEAIKPKLKFNSKGLGYDLGEQFKFHWWDHVFNKAADNITVEKDENGSVKVKHKESLKVSTKRHSLKTKSKFYGGFVKGGTLVGQNESTDSNSITEEQEEDRSLRLSDKELFKICKGRTAHKGARHGLNMTAKLARVREQELLLLQEWNATDPPSSSQEGKDLLHPKKKKKSSKNKDVLNDIQCDLETEPKSNSKKIKKKKRKVLEQDADNENSLSQHKQDLQEINPRKKRNKQKVEVTDATQAETCTITKPKKNKKD